MKFYKILQNFTKFYKILQNFTKFYKILQNFTKFYKISQVLKFFLPVFIEFCNFSLSLIPIQIFFAAFQSLLNLRNFVLLIQK